MLANPRITSLLFFFIFTVAAVKAQKIENITFTRSGDSIDIYYEAVNFGKDVKAILMVYYSLDRGKSYHLCNSVRGDIGLVTVKPSAKITWNYKQDINEIKDDIIFKILVKRMQQFPKAQYYINIGYISPTFTKKSPAEILKINSGFSARIGLQGKGSLGFYIGFTEQNYKIQFDTVVVTPNYLPIKASINEQGFMAGIDYLVLRRGNFIGRISLGYGFEANDSPFIHVQDDGLNFGISSTIKHFNILFEIQRRITNYTSYVNRNNINQSFFIYQYDLDNFNNIIKLNAGIGYTF